MFNFNVGAQVAQSNNSKNSKNAKRAPVLTGGSNVATLGMLSLIAACGGSSGGTADTGGGDNNNNNNDNNGVTFSAFAPDTGSTVDGITHGTDGTIAITENKVHSVAVTLGTVAATGADDLVYSISNYGGYDATYFTIDASTGALRLNPRKQFDYENVLRGDDNLEDKQIVLEITAESRANDAINGKYTVTIQIANDATDDANGGNGGEETETMITGVTTSVEFNDFVEPATANDALTYGAKGDESATLTLKENTNSNVAIDLGTLSATKLETTTAVTTTFINDDGIISIATETNTATIYDPDEANVTYSIIEYDDYDSSYFTIDNNGILKLAAGQVFDREQLKVSDGNITLKIRASYTDAANNTTTDTHTVTINVGDVDEAPVFDANGLVVPVGTSDWGANRISSSASALSMHDTVTGATGDGTILGSITATDEDVGHDINSYEITGFSNAGTRFADLDALKAYFAMDGNNLKLKADQKLDFDTGDAANNQFTFTITATSSSTDTNVNTATHEIRFELASSAEGAPEFDSFVPGDGITAHDGITTNGDTNNAIFTTITIKENTEFADSITLGTIADSDYNAGVVEYSLGGAHNSLEGFLAIDGNTGAITLAAGKQFDYEGANRGTFIVTATSMVSNIIKTDTHTIVLEVANVEELPMFAAAGFVADPSISTNVVASEGTAASTVISMKDSVTGFADGGTILGSISATDDDGDQISYSIASFSGATFTDIAEYFIVDYEGNLKLQAGKSLYFDDNPLGNDNQFTFVVRATSYKGIVEKEFVDHTINFKLTDANAGAPKFSTFVADAAITPTDSGIATDAGANTKRSTTITIDENREFSDAVTLGTIAATDPDGTPVTYGFNGSDSYVLENSTFSIDDTGALTLKGGPFDYESYLSGTFRGGAFTVVAASGEGENSRTPHEIVIAVKDIDDAPVFTEANLPAIVGITENEDAATIGSLFNGNYSAKDEDIKNKNSDITYEITSEAKFQALADKLYLDNWKALKVNPGETFDFEDPSLENGQFTITITATSNGKTVSRALAIEIYGLDDNAPQFADDAPATISVAENTAAGATLGSFAAKDADQDRIAYSIASTHAFGGKLEIDTSGNLKLQDGQTLDYEDTALGGDKQFTVTVTATSGTGVDEKTDTHTVTIQVGNVDDNAPTFAAGAPTSFSVIENKGTHTFGTIAATDLDGDEISYAITASGYTFDGNGVSDYFAIDTNGQLTLKKALDHENGGLNDEKQIALTITATAGTRTGMNTATHVVTIQVTDDVQEDSIAPMFSAFVADDAVSGLGRDGARYAGNDKFYLREDVTITAGTNDALGALVATDTDSDDAAITYAFSSGNFAFGDGTSTDVAEYFTIDSGMLKLVAGKTFDYGDSDAAGKSFTFDITATSASLTATHAVTVQLGDHYTAPEAGGSFSAGLGDDLLVGAAGVDILDGGADNDTLTGNGGADQFWFGKGASDSTNHDTITDFATSADMIIIKTGDRVAPNESAWTVGTKLLRDAVGDNNADTKITVRDDSWDGNSITVKGVESGNDWASDIWFHYTTVGRTGTGDVYGGGEQDYLVGNDGSDTFYGQEGNDIIDGGKGNDNLYGGNASDTLYGGENDDWLYGGSHDDTLYGGAGNDILFGNAGTDKFVFSGDADNGADTIRDFTVGTDKIVIEGGGKSWSDISVDNTGSHAIVTGYGSSGNQLTVQNVDLVETDFTFG